MKRLLLCLLFTSPVFASEVIPIEMYCDNTKEIVKTLRETYKEIPIITGKTSDVAGSIMTIWTNPLTESWTIVATKEDYSCIVGVGTKFNVIDYSKRKSI